jgi:hypothetical protein
MHSEIGHRQKLFNLSEARALLPLVQTITQQQQKQLQPVQTRLNKMLSNDPRRNSIEQDYECVVARWKNKIETLGAAVAGLWLVEFDVGEGVLSWRNPELSLNYFRANNTPFSARVKLADYIETHDPDWVR